LSKFTLYYDGRNSLSTTEDVVCTFEWLKKCFEHVFCDIKNLVILSKITFSANQIEYECSSVEEFKEKSFSQKIEPGELFLMATDGSALIHSLANFWTRNNGPEEKIVITVSTDEKRFLIALKETLDMEPSSIPVPCRNDPNVEPRKIVDEPMQCASTKHEKDITKGIEIKKHKPHIISNLFWQVLVPIIVGVVTAIIVSIFKLSK
jgi:hypothetical protein